MVNAAGRSNVLVKLVIDSTHAVAILVTAAAISGVHAAADSCDDADYARKRVHKKKRRQIAVAMLVIVVATKFTNLAYLSDDDG